MSRRGGVAEREGEGGGGWTCSTCTFINSNSVVGGDAAAVCEMCGTRCPSSDANPTNSTRGSSSNHHDQRNDDSDVSGDDVYFISLIDILQRYDASKQMEHIAKVSYYLFTLLSCIYPLSLLASPKQKALNALPSHDPNKPASAFL